MAVSNARISRWLILLLAIGPSGCTFESAGPVESGDPPEQAEWVQRGDSNVPGEMGTNSAASRESNRSSEQDSFSGNRAGGSDRQEPDSVGLDQDRAEGPSGGQVKHEESVRTSNGKPAGSARPADAESHRRTKVPSKRPIPITFDDLELKMQLDTKFTPSLLTARVKELDGQRVSIKGFIYAAGIFQQTGIRRFPLVKNTQCKFGPGGLAYCVILVTLKDGVTTDFTLQPVTVEGILEVEPFEGPDGNTWSVYRMVGERVE